MEYKEFSSKLGFGISDLAKIGGLFGVASNTVWNWKSRNKVPYEYVVKAMENNWFKDKRAN